MSDDPTRQHIASDPALGAALERLGEQELEQLHAFWLERADGELTTALSFEFVLDDLRQLGAPRPLLELAAASIADEQRHADYCVAWARRVRPDRPDVQARLRGTRPLAFDGASAHDGRVLRTVFGCCFSETVAVHVLLAAHDRITVPIARSLNHEHAKEEVHHARLGWALLAWDGIRRRDREMIAEYASEMCRLTWDLWAADGRPQNPSLESLGYLTSDVIVPACRAALTDVTLPGLRHHGVVVNG